MARTDAQRRAENKHEKEHERIFKLKLNRNTHANEIAHLEAQQNMTAYLVELIREDMRREIATYILSLTTAFGRIEDYTLKAASDGEAIMEAIDLLNKKQHMDSARRGGAEWPHYNEAKVRRIYEWKGNAYGETIAELI